MTDWDSFYVKLIDSVLNFLNEKQFLYQKWIDV